MRFRQMQSIYSALLQSSGTVYVFAHTGLQEMNLTLVKGIEDLREVRQHRRHHRYHEHPAAHRQR